MKTCNSCESGTNPTSVPYVVYESSMARNERTIKKLIIALIVTILLIFASNGLWLWYESQFETIDYSYEQDGNGNNIIGDSNGVDYNGAETKS